MIDAVELAKLIVEEVVYEKGPCIYPGSFKPPHKGHFEAIKNLRSRNYIGEIYIVISPKAKDGITAQQSLETWQTYLKANPIPEVNIDIAPYDSPVTYAYKFIEARPQVKPIYLIGSKGEADDQNYFTSLQKRFGEQVLTIEVEEDRRGASDEKMKQALRTGNYELFRTQVPEAVNSKGYAQALFAMLSNTITEGLEIPVAKPKTIALPDAYCEESRLKEILEQQGLSLTATPQRDMTIDIEAFIEYCHNLLELTDKPEIEIIADISFPQEKKTFGYYSPSERKIGVYITNRNLADIFRTLAHELIHHKQNELGMLTQNAGETGSDIENEANAVAGMLLRDYGRKNPTIYQ